MYVRVVRVVDDRVVVSDVRLLRGAPDRDELQRLQPVRLRVVQRHFPRPVPPRSVVLQAPKRRRAMCRGPPLRRRRRRVPVQVRDGRRRLRLVVDR